MYFQVNGRRTFADTGGEPFERGKPVVIFLNGSGLDHRFWALYSHFFAIKNYAVLALDYPGHTHTEGPQLNRIEKIADWLNDVVTSLDIAGLSLVGHSQGCLVALEYASRYSERLRSVSFIASGLATPVNPVLLEAARHDPQKAIAMMTSWSFASADHPQRTGTPGNEKRGDGKKLFFSDVPGVLAGDLNACDTYQLGEVATTRIHCPTQVILGGQDRMAPRKAGMALVNGLTSDAGKPQLDIIERSGHMVPLEAPDECRRLLQEFICTNNPA